MNRRRLATSLVVCLALAALTSPRAEGESKVGQFVKKMLVEALSARYITDVRVVTPTQYSTTIEVSYANVPEPSQKAFKAVVHPAPPAGADDFQATYAGLETSTGQARITVSLKKSAAPQPVKSEKIEILLVNRSDGTTIDRLMAVYARDWGQAASAGELPARDGPTPIPGREVEVNPIPRGNTPRDTAGSDSMGELVAPAKPAPDRLPFPSAGEEQPARGDTEAIPPNPTRDSEVRALDPSAATPAMISLSGALSPKVNLYALASEAGWRSLEGPIRFNDAGAASGAVVRPIESAVLNDGRKYSSVLITRPGINRGSMVVGTYEITIPLDAFVFETAIGFLEESFSNEKVTFVVSFFTDALGSNTYLMREPVDQPDGVVPRSIALPKELLGKRGQLVLEVECRAASDGNYAAWVLPRIR